MKAAQSSNEEKEAANKTLDDLRELMKKFLTDLQEEGSGESGSNNDNKEGKREGPTTPTWGKRIDEIILEENKEEIVIATGTTVPLIVKCYERTKEGKNPIKDPDVELCASELGIVDISKERSIQGINSGEVIVCFSANNGKVKSNELLVKVVDLKDIKIKTKEAKIRRETSNSITPMERG